MIDPCPECGHDFNTHLLLLDFEGPPLGPGGRAVCPEEGCDCTGTWSYVEIADDNGDGV